MQGFSPLYSPYAPSLMLTLVPLFIVIMLWTVIIKGYALWHAARNGQKNWFVALLVINTLGILEIVYLIWFRSDKQNISSLHSHALHTPAHDSSAQA